MKGQFLLAIDQGTSSSRTVIYDLNARVIASDQQEFPQIYPRPGWVEHDPEAIWSSVTAVTRGALDKADTTALEIAAIGITNQRETALVWERETGQPVGPCVVWQCRRSSPFCNQLKTEGLEPLLRERTGLQVDPMFSAGKLRCRPRCRAGWCSWPSSTRRRWCAWPTGPSGRWCRCGRRPRGAGWGPGGSPAR